MWVGADYWPLEEKWKWRNNYVGFDGKSYYKGLRYIRIC